MSFASYAEKRYLPNDRDTKHNALGVEFNKLISDHNFSAADKLINLDAYAKRVAEVVFDSTTQHASFVRGFKQGMEKSSFSQKVFVAALTEPTTFKYLGVNEKGVPIMRIDYTSGGHEYIKLIAMPDAKGRLLISDFMFASTGELSSVGTANVTKYLVQPAESVLKRLLGGVEPNKELESEFIKLSALRAEGKNKQAYELLQTFPDKIRNAREFLSVSIGLASTFDDDIYRRELARLDKHFGSDPQHAFLLIDHYFYEEDWDRAVTAVETSKSEWADDGAMNVLLAEFLIQDGQMEAAVNASKKAIRLEPENENVYWGAVSVFTRASQFDEVVNVLTTLQEQFSYEFTRDSFTEDPDYSQLVESEAFKAWFKE